MVHVNSLSVDKIWNVVKKIRLETSFKKDCKSDGTYYDYTKYLQVKELEYQLGIESSELKFANITDGEFKNAAEMFLYLSTCPGDLDKDSSKGLEKWFKSYYIFFTNLFKTQSPYQIILTLNRMMISKEANGYDTIREQNLFKQTATLFSLHYEEIQNILPGERRKFSSEILKTMESLDADESKFSHIKQH